MHQLDKGIVSWSSARLRHPRSLQEGILVYVGPQLQCSGFKITKSKQCGPAVLVCRRLSLSLAINLGGGEVWLQGHSSTSRLQLYLMY